ncbi:MAG TPA: hypothetical protein VG733_01790, partial [Chthoniobacteraceae bacterium]|nr:hypothetical protein [Chthoniobacteraceae bacterium]
MSTPALKKCAVVVVALWSAGVSFFSLYGQQPVNTQAQGTKGTRENLKGQYAQQVQAAVKPIQDGYVAALQNLVRTLTQGKDLDGAL